MGGTTSDGLRAHQFTLVPGPESQRLPPELRARRDELEMAVAELREHRPATPDEEYYRRLELLLLDLAKLQSRPPPSGTTGCQ